MRIALYDSGTLEAIGTINFPGESLHDPAGWQLKVPLDPAGAIVAELRLEVVRTFIVNEKRLPAGTWVAVAAGPKTASWCRLALDENERTPIEIPPQHRPHAAAKLREALRMRTP